MKLDHPEPTPIIFDTDMDLDCDDAGALAVLHALMDFNETKILGVIVDVPFEASAKCVMIINNYYNRPEIPVGRNHRRSSLLYLPGTSIFPQNPPLSDSRGLRRCPSGFPAE